MIACPDELWSDRKRTPQFWYVVFHTLFFLDLYLSGSVEGFTPPSPFPMSELDPEGKPPAQPYTKRDLQAYLDHCRNKCQATVEALTGEKGSERCSFRWFEASMSELMLYNVRHVQHHAAQLNLILRQVVNDAPGWVFRAKGGS